MNMYRGPVDTRIVDVFPEQLKMGLERIPDQTLNSRIVQPVSLSAKPFRR